MCRYVVKNRFPDFTFLYKMIILLPKFIKLLIVLHYFELTNITFYEYIDKKIINYILCFPYFLCPFGSILFNLH